MGSFAILSAKCECGDIFHYGSKRPRRLTRGVSAKEILALATVRDEEVKVCGNLGLFDDLFSVEGEKMDAHQYRLSMLRMMVMYLEQKG